MSDQFLFNRRTFMQTAAATTAGLAIGTSAKAAATGQTGQGTETATIAVTVTLDHPKAAGRLVAAPVQDG